MENNFNIPILLLIFNRPDTSQQVFNQIKKIKPSNLFIAGDGPRTQDEKIRVNLNRSIINQIDWPCQIKTLFRETNLGCKIAVSSAINWFFENNEMGIILEDDCVPHPSFFKYCEELLIKYKDEEKVMQICGFNALNRVSIGESYYFAKFGSIWGWATWKRAWQHYDIKMINWPKFKEEKLYKNFCDSYLEEKWRVKIFDRAYNDVYNTWDYQWSFAKLINEGLSIVPANNLIDNIGFGEEATHTGKEPHLNIQTDVGMNFPISHPKVMARNRRLDKIFFNNFVLKNIILNKIHKILGSFAF
jgi:hypothetical protein